VPYLTTSAVAIHYEEVLYQVNAPYLTLPYCTLAAAQRIVIGPVCLWVGGSVTTITRNCVHRSSPNWVSR